MAVLSRGPRADPELSRARPGLVVGPDYSCGI